MRSRISAAAVRRRRVQVAEATASPIAFVEYVGQDIDPDFTLADVHRTWLETWWRVPESVTHSSVGLGKSTLARLFVIWLLGSDPEEVVLWIGSTQKQPKTQLGAIAAMIESPGYRARLHHIFPRLRPGRIWRSTEIVHANAALGEAHSSLTVFGAFADSVLGARATTVVFDDICTWANTLTADGRQKMIDWLGSVFSRLTKDKIRVIALGNFWHKDDALSHMARTPGFAYTKTPAYTIDPDGERVPTAPQCLSLKKIASLERKLGPIQSARMLQCEGISDNIGRFRERWFEAAIEAGRREGIRFRPADLNTPVYGACFTGVDFGHTKKIGSDLTSMVTCMVLADGRRAIIDVRSGRWDTVEIRRNLREVWLAYRPIIGVESNGGQAMASELMSEALAIPLMDKNTGVNKWHYANGVEGLANELAQGYWLFPASPAPTPSRQGLIEPGEASTTWTLDVERAGQPHAEIQELINEALVFDPSKHTGDRLMAWWICAETLRTSATGALMGEQLAAEGPDIDWMAR